MAIIYTPAQRRARPKAADLEEQVRATILIDSHGHVGTFTTHGAGPLTTKGGAGSITTEISASNANTICDQGRAGSAEIAPFGFLRGF
jgi:hypothetical protein